MDQHVGVCCFSPPALTQSCPSLGTATNIQGKRLILAGDHLQLVCCPLQIPFWILSLVFIRLDFLLELIVLVSSELLIFLYA